MSIAILYWIYLTELLLQSLSQRQYFFIMCTHTLYISVSQNKNTIYVMFTYLIIKTIVHKRCPKLHISRSIWINYNEVLLFHIYTSFWITPLYYAWTVYTSYFMFLVICEKIQPNSNTSGVLFLMNHVFTLHMFHWWSLPACCPYLEHSNCWNLKQTLCYSRSVKRAKPAHWPVR